MAVFTAANINICLRTQLTRHLLTEFKRQLTRSSKSSVETPLTLSGHMPEIHLLSLLQSTTPKETSFSKLCMQFRVLGDYGVDGGRILTRIINNLCVRLRVELMRRRTVPRRMRCCEERNATSVSILLRQLCAQENSAACH